MLLKHSVLQKIADGSIELVFRRWKKPTVRAGGTLRTAVGVVAIDAIDVVKSSQVRAADARRAGYDTRVALMKDLASRQGPIYRIAVRLAGPDQRIALRQSKITDKKAMAEVEHRLERFDKASRDGAWTVSYLELIAGQPGVRAADLASSLGLEKKPFKQRVRKLKELGLTESLETGYQLSPRGQSFLRRLSGLSRRGQVGG